MWRLRLDGQGRPVEAPKKVSGPLGTILAASVGDGGLEAWFHRGVLTRLRIPREGATTTEDLVSGQQFEVLAVRPGAGATFTLTSAGGQTTLHRF